MINRTLTLKPHKRPGNMTKDIVSHDKLYKELSECMLNNIEVKNLSLSTCKMTKPTKKQIELLDRIGMTFLVNFTKVERQANQKKV